MHSADAVIYPVVRSRRAGGLLALIWLAGMSSVCRWCATVPAGDWLRAALLLWTLAAGAAAAWWWMRSGGGQLHWNGQDWSLESTDGRACSLSISQARVVVGLDLQSLLVLRLAAPRRGRWVLVDRSAARQRWHALRCAVTAAAALPTSPTDLEPSVR